MESIRRAAAFVLVTAIAAIVCGCTVFAGLALLSGRPINRGMDI